MRIFCTGTKASTNMGRSVKVLLLKVHTFVQIMVTHEKRSWIRQQEIF